MVEAIIQTALRFRLLVLLVAGGLLIFGVSHLRSAPADTLPEFGPPVVTVQTESLGLSQTEVEQLTTVPMEQDLLNGVKDVDRITSDSVAGTSVIRMVFKRGTDLLRDRQLVQERLTQAFALPNVSKPPQMLQPTSSTSHVMVLGVRSARLSPIELSVLARWTIRPRLLGIPGVANVSIWGLRDRQLQVLVDPARLARHRVALSRVISTVGNAQLVSPLTYLDASTPGTGGFLDTPNQRLSVRHILPFGEPGNLGEVPVDQKRDVDLGDVATVVEGHQPLIGDAVVGNGPGLVIAIDKLPGASTLGVTRAVDQVLAQLRPGLGDVRIDGSVFRPASYVRDGLHNLALALVAAAILVLLVLVALRRSWRTILVAAVAICVSMVTGATVLDLLGYSFSALAFTGLAVGLVVVIDQALSEGRRASRPLGFGALIAVVVAVPLLLVRGMTGAFIHPAVVAYLLAVGCSILVAVTVAPALRSLLEGVGGPPRASRSAALSGRVRRAYAGWLDRMSRLPRSAALAICVPGLVLVGLAPTLGEPQRPSFKDRDVVMSLEGYNDMSLPEIARVARRTSSALERLRGVRDVAAAVGRASTSGEVGETNSAQLWVSLRADTDYTRALRAVNGVVSQLPGVAATVETYESARSFGVLSPSNGSPVIRVYGQDYGTLARSAAQVQHAVLGIPGVHSAHALLPRREPVLQVQVNLERAQQSGIKPGDVRREVSTLLSGLTVGNFFEQQKVFDVVVQGTPAIRDSLSRVRALLIDTPWGGHVRLGELASVHVAPDPIDIRHDAVSRFVDVVVGVGGPSSGGVRASIGRRLAELRFPLEYHAELLPTAPADDTAPGRFLSYCIAAALMVFLLLQAASRSWRLAAVVFSILPLAVTGAVLVAVAMGDQSSLGATAGLAAVLIMAARQLVALVSFRSDDTDPPSREALLRAAQERLGPVLSSSAVIAAAALPLVVLGDVPGTEILHPMAAVVLGGIVTILLVALLITPTVCLRLGFGAQALQGAVQTPAPPGDIRPQEV